MGMTGLIPDASAAVMMGSMYAAKAEGLGVLFGPDQY